MYAHHQKEIRLNIQQYISSGIIESYVMGVAPPEEASQLERLLPFYPELQSAISDFGFQLELFAIQHEEPPPPGLFDRISDRLRELPAVREPEPTNDRRNPVEDGYIPVKENSTHIRVHKYWRIAFIVIFILSKLLLAAFIYYFIQFRRSEQEIQSMRDREHKVRLTSDSPEQ